MLLLIKERINAMKIVIINHSFQKKEFYKRWEWLANNHEDIDITLLAPKEWVWGAEKNLTYGKSERIEGIERESKRFRIKLVSIRKNRLGEWTSIDMVREIINIKPDFIYFIGGSSTLPVMQLIFAKKIYRLKETKLLCFSMRGSQSAISHRVRNNSFKARFRHIIDLGYSTFKLRLFNKYCDAVFCHYPDAMKAFRADGYKGPIYMQTQVGVDPDIFGPNEESRLRIREKYNIGASFLFGSASRFHYSKGLSEIIKALPDEGDWKYLMMGWGRPDEVDKIKNEIKARGLEDRIILTGYIDNWNDMAAHWNALDCAIHTPLTTPDWEETFSLALVQEMITALPVIGSTSGSVPYQIGPDGIVVKEGDIDELSRTMLNVLTDKSGNKILGQRMRERALNCFSIYHLDELFYETLKDIQKGIYSEDKIDMACCGTVGIKWRKRYE